MNVNISLLQGDNAAVWKRLEKMVPGFWLKNFGKVGGSYVHRSDSPGGAGAGD